MLYYCDECNTGPLQGKRYRCQTCEEFDLCQKCFEANKHRENGHRFVDIKIDDVEEEQQQITSPPSVAEEEGTPSLSLLPRQRKSTAMDPTSRMDVLFNRINVRLPPSAVSSTTAVQFLDLYEQANESLKETKSKRVKALEQIMAKTALALLGVKLRKNTTGTKPVIAQADGDTAITAMKGFMSQLLIFNQTIAEETEPMRKELARARVKRIEFSRFYSDVMDALETCKQSQPKPSATTISALDELKELLGYDGIQSAAKKKTTKPSPTTSSSTKRKKQEGEDVVAVVEKRPRVEGEKETAPANECKVQLVPLSPQSPLRLQPLKESPMDILRNADALQYASSVEADDMRAMLNKLREDLNDAHARIDVLVHLLREAVGVPLQHALENLLKT